MLLTLFACVIFAIAFIIFCAALGHAHGKIDDLEAALKTSKKFEKIAIRLDKENTKLKDEVGEAASLTAKQADKIKELKKKIFDLENYQSHMAREYEEMYKQRNHTERLRIVDVVLNSIHRLTPALLAESLAGKTYMAEPQDGEI